MRVRIASHNMGHGSRELATALSQRLGQRVLRLRRDGGTFEPRPTDVIINWGPSGERPHRPVARIINCPGAIRIAQDKLRSFQAFQEGGVSIPEFTTDSTVAQGWLSTGDVVARHLLRGSSARGLELVHAVAGARVPSAPLYTKYIKKSAEYRVHVVRGEVIDYAQKKARAGEDVDYQIRSHDNGWIFAREGVHPPACVLDEAIKAVEALGLDFGAVDVIYNQRHDRAYVLEVNTAPGLEGTTVERYADALAGVINNEVARTG